MTQTPMARVVYYGTTPLRVKKAVIDTATSPDTDIVAAVPGKIICVVSGFYFSSGTTTVRFESGAGGTALTGQMQHTAQTGMVWPFNPGGWFETLAGEALSLELGSAVSVDGVVAYIEIPA